MTRLYILGQIPTKTTCFVHKIATLLGCSKVWKCFQFGRPDTNKQTDKYTIHHRLRPSCSFYGVRYSFDSSTSSTFLISKIQLDQAWNQFELGCWFPWACPKLVILASHILPVGLSCAQNQVCIWKNLQLHLLLFHKVKGPHKLRSHMGCNGQGKSSHWNIHDAGILDYVCHHFDRHHRKPLRHRQKFLRSLYFQ